MPDQRTPNLSPCRDNIKREDANRPELRGKALLALIFVGICVVFYLSGYTDLSIESLKRHHKELLGWTNQNHLLAMSIFLAAYILLVVFSLPGATWMTLVGGFLFGTVVAIILVVSAATIGAGAIFLIARYCLANYLKSRIGALVLKIADGFQKNAFSYLMFLRLVPLFPFWLVNLVPALLGVRLRTFLIGTFIGIIPGTAAYCSVGNGLRLVFDTGKTLDFNVILRPEILISLIMLGLLSLLPVVYKWVRGRYGRLYQNN